MTKPKGMTAAERKRAQRQRDKLSGWTEVTIKVATDQVQAVRDFAACLPEPTPPTDPNQLSLIDQLDRAIAGGDASPDEREEPDQGNLF